MTEEAEVIFDVQGGLGIITLNRPRALNALNLNMIRQMTPQLQKWAEDKAVHAVIIRGAGDRAFCSGGDVKAVALDALAFSEGKSDGKLTQDFFREEYILNHCIHTFSKPYISLINGIVMGGGKGLSAHGSHRIVTENTLFAMPETNIGFFPDVGGGYFLPRCPGQTGTYLALTSKRVQAIDAIYIGFATHFVPLENLADLTQALMNIDWDAPDDAETLVEKVIDTFDTAPLGESEIAPERDKIDKYFSHDRIEDIVAGLQEDGGAWAQETLTDLYGMSPTSLKVSLKQIRMGMKMPFAQVMTMEYRLSQSFVKTHDFYEGIRAALIDKDRNPQWEPAKIADVQDNIVDSYFQSLDERDLVF